MNGTLTGITAGTTNDLTGTYFNITSITSFAPGVPVGLQSGIGSYLNGNGSSLTTDANGNVVAGTFIGFAPDGSAGVIVNNSAALFVGSPTIVEIIGANPTFSAPMTGTPAVTPLPGSVWMFGSALALGGLVTMMRRRRSATSLASG